MARTGITYDEVAAAADGLVGNGEQPTIQAIRTVLGTGSPNTIHRHLTTWKQAASPAEQRKAPELPAELQTSIVREIEKQAASARSEIEHKFVEAQSTANDLAAIGEELENKNADLEELNQGLSNQVQQLTALSSERLIELNKTEIELKSERENSEKTRLQLAQALNKNETLESQIILLNNKVNELQIKTDEVTKDKIKAEQQAAVLEARLESEKSISNDLKLRLTTTETDLKELRTETKAELQKTNQVLIKALNDAAELEKQLELAQRDNVSVMTENNNLENKIELLNADILDLNKKLTEFTAKSDN